MVEDTPAARYARSSKAHEIGGTAGQEHREVLERTLGRREGLAAATGVDERHEPIVVGGEAAREAPVDAQRMEPGLESSKENQEINRKKLERHGNLSDAARRGPDGEEDPRVGALRDD